MISVIDDKVPLHRRDYLSEEGFCFWNARRKDAKSERGLTYKELWGGEDSEPITHFSLMNMF